MEEVVSARIYVPSYHRYDSIKTYHLLEDCTYVVRKSEEQNYLDAGIPADKLWAVEDDKIDAVDKVYWYIIDHAEEDMICICDDDCDDFQYMLDFNYDCQIDKAVITAELERQMQLLYDLDIGFGFLQPNAIPYNYISEFCFKAISGAVKFFNRKKFSAKYDPAVRQNFDLDMILQELLRNRVVLSPRYFYDKGIIDKNAGGGSGKLRKEQLDSISNMKVKWGKYFKFDESKNKPSIQVKR